MTELSESEKRVAKGLGISEEHYLARRAEAARRREAAKLTAEGKKIIEVDADLETVFDALLDKAYAHGYLHAIEDGGEVKDRVEKMLQEADKTLDLYVMMPKS